MIIQSPDPILRRKAAQVDKIDSWICKTLGRMEKIVEAHNAVGLAAPQIAISLAFFVMKRNDGTFLHVINPHIAPVSDDQSIQNESCLSMPGISVPVKRYNQIFLDYIDEDAAHQIVRLSGLEARVAQHEYDHLLGILITDHIDGYFRNTDMY